MEILSGGSTRFNAMHGDKSISPLFNNSRSYSLCHNQIFSSPSQPGGNPLPLVLGLSFDRDSPPYDHPLI
jgi:hypothetical protein